MNKLGTQSHPSCDAAQVAITRELSRISARLSAILTNPRLWFDPEAREQFREGIEVHLDR